MWQIPKHKLPMRKPLESDWEYFLKLQQWAKSLGLPPEFFVRENFSKPQYVSLNNPLLVALFESWINLCGNTLQIEEMLPGANQMLRVNGGDRAVEFLCQWYVLSQ
jgi:hypothetical protein